MQTNRIYLRALEPDDYKTTIKWRNDDEIWSMVGGPKHFVSTAYEKEWILNAISNKNEIRLGICLVENNQLIGLCSVIDIDWINRSAHCPSMIGEKQYWNKGYGTEARKLLLEFAFKERCFERVWALVLESNIGSAKMLEKCSYKKEGILRNSVYKNGRYQNQIIFSILSSEYFSAIEKKK